MTVWALDQATTSNVPQAVWIDVFPEPVHTQPRIRLMRAPADLDFEIEQSFPARRASRAHHVEIELAQ
jgi:hypothetical protein